MKILFGIDFLQNLHFFYVTNIWITYVKVDGNLPYNEVNILTLLIFIISHQIHLQAYFLMFK